MSSARALYSIRPRDVLEDVEASEVPPEFYTEARNVNFRNELAQRVEGYDAIFAGPVAAPLHLRPVLTPTVAYWAYGCSDKIGVTDGATHSDITPTPAPNSIDANDWTSSMLNGVPVLNPRLSQPVYWDTAPSNPCVALPGWPAGYLVDAMRSFKNYLIGMGVNDGSSYDPNLVIWSDAAPAGQLPASWTPAANNDAGDVSLADTPGAVIDGAPLRDQFMLYKRGSTYSLDYIGGNFIFNRRKLFVTSGVLARNCITEVRGRHIVLADGDVIMHDGFQAESIVDRKWRRFLFDNIDGQYFYNAFVARNEAKSEVWFCVPFKGDQYPSKAVVWNYQENRFGLRELCTQTLATHAASGIVPAAAAPGASWDSSTGTWDSSTTIWNQTNFNPAEDELVQANIDSTFYAIDLGSDAAGVPIDARLLRESLDFGEPDRVKTVRAVWPRITGAKNGSVSIRIGSQEKPFDPILWSAAVPFNTDADEKVDTFTTGRFISVEVISSGGAPWRCSGFDFEYTRRGRY